ncbi:hypothetical protein [Epilithonimonas arachidiradicis]|uniref:Uncharacterized protein n=1 Tax=Epilithonimonas arachidiradicis TaxID=1617282 RepID=A0A420DD07_9FLAO|nr:hypothetical protein [Epilithonimonas arachidiradicis]RKE89775.1 hypothetical protein BXY58_0352 [Epilithonimonas arachidiradicis]GGG45234.1 hypothetical protein GCM10007332_03350 [Epilithonimonas arachidiradicis]
MQNLQDTYKKIFAEIKILLSELAESDSYEAILNKENEINQLYQKFSFLKISQKFDYSSIEIEPLESIDNQSTNVNSDLLSVEKFEDENKVAEIIVEETEVHDIFEDVPEVEEVHSFAEIDAQENLVEETVFENEIVGQTEEKNQLNEIIENEIEVGNQNEEFKEQISETELVNEIEAQNYHEEIVEAVEEIEAEEEKLLEEPAEKLEPMQDSQFSFAMTKDESNAGNSQDDYETRLAEKEAKLKELEENRRKIVEFSKENTQPKEKSQQVYESQNQEEHHDKKFKLANIKGLKIAKSLFDDDHLEEVEKPAPVQTSGSLLKNNVPTDYMEAPKPKPEFKLDLNDRIAFSQYLFNGSQSELNQVVTVLNSFNSLDKAQEYLSDIYYERDWKKVDNYAQRLWTLVENRFL